MTSSRPIEMRIGSTLWVPLLVLTPPGTDETPPTAQRCHQRINLHAWSGNDTRRPEGGMIFFSIYYPATNPLFIKANVMIDQNGRARLTDFGLLTFVSDPTNPTNSGSVTNAGTTRWMSPELLHPEKFGFEQSRPTMKSDCYALGMVILEVLSEERPFARDKEVIVMRKVIEGERPDRPEEVWFTDDLWITLEQCWLPLPNDRPTVGAVLDKLKHLENAPNSWKPSLPIMEGVGAYGNDSASTISQGRFPHLVQDTLYTD